MKKRKKGYLNIAMLGHKRIPSREGGIEIVVQELSTRMVEYGHMVTCYNRDGHHVSGREFDTEKLDEYKGVQLKTVFSINIKGLSALTSSFFGAVKVAFGRYDIIHFHAEGPCIMLWLPKLFGKRCIATIHGLDWQRAKWGRIAKACIMLGEKVAVKYADEIIVLSDEVKKYFIKTYGRETKYIPNGVSYPKVIKSNLIKQKFGLEKDNYILFLGRIVPEKGLQYLIEAFKKINTDKMLVIAGGVSDTYDFLQDLINLGKEDKRILFTGFVQGELLDELYSNAYIYVLPSDVEGMPLSLLEAMSYGNCCLVSDIAECREVVENQAVLFKKSDVDDLIAKMQKLCDDNRIVQKYKSESSKFICNKYNWDNVVRETLQVYEKIC